MNRVVTTVGCIVVSVVLTACGSDDQPDSATRPEELAALQTLLDRLDNEMAEPLWPPLMEVNIAVDYTLDKQPDEPHETIIWSN